MDMTAMLAKAWRGMMRRRRQRLALEELVRMAPHRRDELGIDLVALREASACADGRRRPSRPARCRASAGWGSELNGCPGTESSF